MITIVIQGGHVHRVLTDSRHGHGLGTARIIDYDVEGLDERLLVEVEEREGDRRLALVRYEDIGPDVH